MLANRFGICDANWETGQGWALCRVELSRQITRRSPTAAMNTALPHSHMSARQFGAA
jgi:hypothetical protein